jgi:hypothetical protein
MVAIKAAGRRTWWWGAQLGIGLALLAAGAATAAAEPATQQVIPATELPYIGVSGFFTFVAREGTSASGNTSFGGTVTAHDVVVTDGSSLYSLRGTNRFGGGENAQSGAVRDSAGLHYQIVGPTGVVDSVRIVERVVEDGTVQFDHGTCERPG